MPKEKPQTAWKAKEIERLVILIEAGKSDTFVSESLRRSKASIRSKANKLGLEFAKRGKERKCMNFAHCGNFFHSEFAGLCPRCRMQSSPSIFELPASLRSA